MPADRDSLELLIRLHEQNSPDYTLHLGGNTYAITNVSIENSPIPVNKPTSRGGVYFSDKFAYKMRGTVKDLSVIPLLTKNMLGPNTEFGNLKIMTEIKHEGRPTSIEILTNLTSSVQTPDSIELGMILVELKSSLF